ncbi:TPA: ead/Ea22-like family protein [Salmonella enterica]|nr:ead/Ea22-like family protein [Salmonella enterica subsp. enterica serovar Muenchen]EEM0945590.1 ead/Ea22-like family protein [Salmonella enterica subsp. enterica serovar Muenchen]HAF4804676.1 ead/Ea22-like family protein [Salmonella enterica]
MSNIDKQALREAAEKATRGPWEMERENIWFTDEDGYTKHLAYVQQGDDVDDKQDHYNTAFIAAANPATMLALLDENLQLQREKDATEAVALALRDDMRQAREQLEAAEKRIADGSKRIAELEARDVNLPKRSVGEVMHLSGFSRDYAEGWCAGNDNAMHEIRAAGIKVKE